MGTNNDQYRLGYRGDIEGLRAIAILLVIGAHAGVPWLRGGFVGVDVFFVLSGFLITGLLVREVAESGRLRFADFYIRRLRRLLPALVVMLVGTAWLASLLLAPIGQFPQAPAAATAVAWVSNIHFAWERLDYFSPGTATNLYLHTWSLGVEEQFYLVWPALVYLLLRNQPHSKGLARLRMVMAAVVAVSFVGCVVATYKAPQMAFYLTPLRAWQFAVGALVWLHFVEGRKEGQRTSGFQVPYWTGWLGLVLLLCAGWLLDDNRPYPGVYSLIPTLGAACVIAAGCRDDISRGVSQWLSCRPMQAIGRVSYAWYLWHWPVLLLGHAMTGVNTPVYRLGYVLVSLLLAVVSYRCVEYPIRHQKWWMAHQRVSIYGALALILLLNVGFQRWGADAYAAARSPAQLRFAIAKADSPAVYGMGCDDWFHSDKVKICAFGSKQATHVVVLMGDSIAGQWFPAVAKVFNRPDWRLLVLTKSSCPMVDEPFFYARIGRLYTECSTWRDLALSEIVALKPDVVLLGTVATNPFSQAQWTEGTARVLDRLSTSVGHVYVLRGTPELPFDGPDCLSSQAARPSWLGGRSICSAAAVNDQEDHVYRWLEDATSRFKNATVLDMNDLVCPGETCAAQQNGVIVFRDSQHMTATFAESLGDALGKRLGLDQSLTVSKASLPGRGTASQ